VLTPTLRKLERDGHGEMIVDVRAYLDSTMVMYTILRNEAR